MKVWLPLLLCAAILGGMYSCKKSSGSPIPRIEELVTLSPDSVKGGSALDTAFITFSFSDGDGDLGNDIINGTYDVYLADSRDSIFNQRFPFPPIPDDAIDPVDGIKGTGAIALLASNLIPRQDTLHKYRGDTVNYTMWILDKAGHKSNVIKVPPLYILP